MINLRPYQQELITEIFDAWSAGHRNVLAVSPTGSGKAFTLCSIAQHLAENVGLPTIILVHRQELVSQLCQSLATLGVYHNIVAPKNVILDTVEIQKKLFNNKSFYKFSAPVTVASVQTINARAGDVNYQKVLAKQKIWIQDEAHHMLKNNQWGKVLEFLPQECFGIGFTATPQRLDKKGLGRHAFGVFDHMVIGPTTRWLIDNGFLSKYKIVVPDSDYRKYLKDDGSQTKDYSQQAREYASMHSHIIGDVVKNYIKHLNGKQTIVFADSIEAAKRMEKEFLDNKISAKLLTAETNPKERFKAIQDYKNHVINVLINVDLFGEGFDVPSTYGVIMARPTKSLSMFLQICGRALRVMKGKPYAILIDHVGNIKYHQLPCNIRRWTLDNGVKKRETTNLIRICTNETCNTVYDRALHVCPYCGTEDKPSNRLSTARSPKEMLEVVDGDMELLDPETIRMFEKQTILENPYDVEARVAAAAGGPAGKKARKNQEERIATQKELTDVIALWIAKMKKYAYTERQIKKLFYAKYDVSMTGALSVPKADMLYYIDLIKGDI